MKLHDRSLQQARRSGAWLLVCAILCLRLGGAHAAEPTAATQTNLLELSLDDLLKVKVQTVTSAAKYAQPTALAPASVTIVTDRDIQLHGYRNLTEVLGSVRGFYSTYDRNYHYLGVRGFNRPGDYNSRVLLLIDGHRVNDVVYDGAPIGNDGYLDVDMIDRVELAAQLHALHPRAGARMVRQRERLQPARPPLPQRRRR